MALAVPLVPLLNSVAAAGLGVGTLERIGAIGPSTPWVVPLSSAIAAAVIGVTAHRRSALVERSQRPLLALGDRDQTCEISERGESGGEIESVLESFCRAFE